MDARTRLDWVRLYEEAGNAGVVCRRGGISRPTLRAWWRRHQAEGEVGRHDRSRRPHHSPNQGAHRRGVEPASAPRAPARGCQRAWRIKFRPIRPRSPHLNGKIERAQRTALEELRACADLKTQGPGDERAEWQTFFNWRRPHSARGGKTPIDRVCELLPKIPMTEQVGDACLPSRKPSRTQGYHGDTTFARLKR